MYVTSKLSVSEKDNLDCLEMAKYLSKYKIVTSISANISTQPDLEYGCNLTQSINSKESLKVIWNLLVNKYNFKCGHLKVGDSFDGCILDFLEDSKCI